MQSPDPNEPTLEPTLEQLEHKLRRELKPRSPRAPAQARMRSALQDAKTAEQLGQQTEQQLAALSPTPPSERLRERIASALTAERVAETAALSAGTIAITEAPKDSSSTLRSRAPLRTGFAVAAAAAAAIALLWFGFLQAPNQQDVIVNTDPKPVPEQQTAPAPNIVPEPDGIAQVTPAKTFPLPFAPVSAERSVIETEDGGIELIDGRPVRVLHVKLLDKLEYEQEGRRVIVERPVRQTVYNQLAYH